MKKYIFLIIFFLITLFSIHNVYAAVLPGWAYDKKHPVRADVFDCGNNNCSSSLNTDGDLIDTSNYFYYQGTYTSMSANGSGILWSYVLDNPLKSDYLYSISTYVCHTANANFVNKNSYASGSFAGITNLSATVTTYYKGAFTNLEVMPFDTSSIGYSKCGVLTAIIKPNQNANYYGINFTLDTSASNYTSALVGYEISNLGIATQLTSSDIQSIINNSGLASASDINSLNSSVNNIQSSLSSVQSSINNNIDDAESNIINSQEQTRDAIINNQNENTEKEIESQKVCRTISIDKESIVSDGFLNSDGSITSSSGYGITDYLSIDGTISVLRSYNSSSSYLCFYKENKTFLSCVSNSSVSEGSTITPPSLAKYVKFSISKNYNRPQIEMDSCKNGNQAIADGQQDINNTLNNSDSSGATNEAGGFFSNFTSDTHGLTGIITAPLSAIQGLINNTCSPLVLPLPFVNRNLTLPCLSSIYSNYFGTFFTMYQTITLGIVSYWVLVRIFALVKDFKNPEHDEIEVVEL